MCLEGIPRQHAAPRKWLGWEAKGWKRRKERERPGLREQESMRNRKRGMRPLGETGKLRDPERGGCTERYKLRTPKVSRDGEESEPPLETEKKAGEGRHRE